MAKKAVKKAAPAKKSTAKRGRGAPKLAPAIKKARRAALEKHAKAKGISLAMAKRLVRFKRGTADVAKVLARPAKVSAKKSAAAKKAGRKGGVKAKAKSHNAASKAKAKATKKRTGTAKKAVKKVAKK
jgi:hypothetical protein